MTLEQFEEYCRATPPKQRMTAISDVVAERDRLKAENVALLAAAKLAEPAVWLLAAEGIADSAAIHAQLRAAIALAEKP